MKKKKNVSGKIVLAKFTLICKYLFVFIKIHYNTSKTILVFSNIHRKLDFQYYFSKFIYL